MPQVQFTYTSLTNYYEDFYFKPNPSTNCGPSWNTGTGSGCLLWEQSYANNSRFLATVSNGQGLSQSFSWKLARNNSHGVPGGGSNNADPFYCDSHQTTAPCQEVDDSGWSHVVLLSESSTTVRLTQNGQGGQQTSTPITETTNYSYQLTYPLPAQECSDCVAGMYWGDQNNNNYLNYYDSTFMGFAQTTVNLPSGAVEVHKFSAGEGWGIYDPGQVTCYTPSPCHKAPWWDLANVAHGHEYQTLVYDTDGTTLLKETDTTSSATCPPAGVSPTPPVGSITWDGKLISDLDHNNPVAVCDLHQTQQVVKTFDGASSAQTTTTTWTDDSFGRVTQESTTTNGGTPGTVVKNTSYVWNDAVTATTTSANGTYLIDTVAFSDTEDGSGNRLACTYTSYDGQSYATGQSSGLTGGLKTSSTSYADCGSSANGYTPGGPSTTTTKYDAFGDVVASDDPDANAGISGHTGCTVSGTAYTTCTSYESTFQVFPTSTGNALNQTSSTSYGNTGALFGFGTWPQSTTDANGQTTSYTYDALGRMTGETLPGETSGEQTKQWVYTTWCSGTAAQAPCEEIDEIDRLDSSTTTTTRAFYDGEGRLVETRAPGPVGQDVVTYAYLDTSGRAIFKSNPYFVTAYTGAPGAAAYSIPDSTQPGTSTSYPNLRTTSVTDPNSHTATTTASVVCGVSGTSDSGCYVQNMLVDANGHERATLTGGLGKTNDTQTYTGTSGSYALYATTIFTYNATGDLLSTHSPDGSTTRSSYDSLGRITSTTDPDRGTTTYTYDANGNPTQQVHARGDTGTIYAGYDGLNRPLWRNNTNSASGAWVAYTYDSTANGNQGVGSLTGESFTGSGGLSGSYAYTYDIRGRQTAQTLTVNGTSYPLQIAFNDTNQVTSETYPTGEIVTNGYDANGWLIRLSTQIGSTITTLASNLSYSGLAGAAGKITSMALGSGDIYTASYDTGIRLISSSLTRASDNTLLYQTQPAYDAGNNVVNVQTSLAGATDTQQFCYDALNRLTWAGATGTPPCASFTPGTLTAAQYQQSYSYNVDGALTSGPNGSYTYGNSNQPHTLTSTSNGYSAAYDASGDQTCRSLSSATTCSGSSPTGQIMSYDAEQRLSTWESQPSSPAARENYLYDGEGNRVATLSTVSGTSTLTAYIGSAEEVQTTGSTTQTTTYYLAAGMRVAAKVNGTLYYFGYDALGSQVVVLNSNGNLVGSQLYGPYGTSRYSTGTLPTSLGFTGQRSDSVTGLDYYVARYYDPVVGVFLSPDSMQGNEQGISPYVYVEGDPETRTDPTGHCDWWNPVCDLQALGNAVGGAIDGAASDVGGFLDAVGQAVGGFLSDWAGPIGNLIGIGWWLAHPQQLGCGCITPSQPASASTTIADAQSIAGSMPIPRAWNKEEQKQLAKDLSRDAANGRAAAIKRYNKTKEGEDPHRANAAAAVLTITVGGVTRSYQNVALGYEGSNQKRHAEQLLIVWAEKVIGSFKGSLAGAVINLLIFTQTAICSGCTSQFTSNTWLNTLYAATGLPGGQAEINLDVWQTDPDPGSISGVTSVCEGSTDGITSTGTC